MDKRMRNRAKLGPTRIGIIVTSILLIAISWLMVLRARQGLAIRSLPHDDLPLLYIGPAEPAVDMPGVIIAHGFSGSKQLMQGFAFALAHAGYATISLDFTGHGTNQNPFDRAGVGLQSDLAEAYRVLLAQPGVDSRQVALLGHSMGSGAVMTAGIEEAERYAATIAVSPTDAAVTAVAPRNLFLLAGQLEPPFARNAEDLLQRAGGANNGFGTGAARSFQLIPLVEHISILFAPTAHDAALNWLNRSFGLNWTTDYIDSRMVWYLLQLGAWLLLATAVSPLVRFPKIEESAIRRPPWHWLALLLAPAVATAVLFLLNLFIPVVDVGGILIAGAVGIWLLTAGLVWLAAGYRPQRPTLKSIWWGLFIFAYLWLAFGLLAQVVWLPWLLVPARISRWLLLAPALLPLTLAAGYAQQGGTVGRRFAWWLGQSLVLSVGLLTAVFLVPGLFFLVLILPLLPIVIGLMAVVGGAVDEPWAVGLGNAMFFAWLLIALFPLV